MDGKQKVIIRTVQNVYLFLPESKEKYAKFPYSRVQDK